MNSSVNNRNHFQAKGKSTGTQRGSVLMHQDEGRSLNIYNYIFITLQIMTTVRNYITLIGSMGTNTQITKFDNGKSVARFKLETKKAERKNDGNYRNITQYHRVFAWGNLAEFIEQYGEKGKKVAIHGRLVNRTYLNSEGKQRNTTEVEVRQIFGL